MPICEKCRKLSPSVIARQCDDMLCNECDAECIATLEIERQQRQLQEATEVSPVETPPPPPGNSEMYNPESQCEGESLVTPGSKGSYDSRVADHVHSASDSGATVEAAEPPRQTSITSGKCNDKTKSPQSKKSKYIIACVKDCKFNGKKSGGGDFIRCCLCAEWYHEKCVGIKSNESPGLWPCPNCRTMASDVKLLSESVKKLAESLGLSAIDKQSNVCSFKSKHDLCYDHKDDIGVNLNHAFWIKVNNKTRNNHHQRQSNSPQGASKQPGTQPQSRPQFIPQSRGRQLNPPPWVTRPRDQAAAMQPAWGHHHQPHGQPHGGTYRHRPGGRPGGGGTHKHQRQAGSQTNTERLNMASSQASSQQP